ncbi:MAG: hypothetical protein GEU91_13985 [Rhizobiales bacterium]|nr:hypothetical protein [Hyphomicrobiales bacterium]
MAKRSSRAKPADSPTHEPDVFATDFDVHDFEDWLRVICWVEEVEPGDGAKATRRQAAALVMPRSSLAKLMQVLRVSAGQHRESGRHS